MTITTATPETTAAKSVPLRAPAPRHLVELDAIRGVAAVIVMFDHFRRLWAETGHPHWVDISQASSPLWLLFDGHAAVLVFFLLSGFVLSLPTYHGKKTSYVVYAARRITRIYPPYIVAVALAAIACYFFAGHAMYGAEFHKTWATIPTWHSLREHLVFIGSIDPLPYDPPIWSLVHEMRISLVFPLLCWIAYRVRGLFALAIAFLFPVAALLLDHTHKFYLRDLTAWTYTLSYCGIFLIGATMARYQDALRAFAGRLASAVKWTLAAVALYLLGYTPVHLRYVGDIVGSLGGSYLIMIAITEHGALPRILRSAVPQFLGRISYSLYLLHVPILMVLSILLFQRIPYGMLLVPFLLISVAAAALYYRAVEAPSIALGRYVGRKLQAVA